LANDTQPGDYWYRAVLFYGASATGNLLLLLPPSRFLTATDSTGIEWRVGRLSRVALQLTGVSQFWPVTTSRRVAVLKWVPWPERSVGQEPLELAHKSAVAGCRFPPASRDHIAAAPAAPESRPGAPNLAALPSCPDRASFKTVASYYSNYTRVPCYETLLYKPQNIRLGSRFAG
jgi:hypothetical protein